MRPPVHAVSIGLSIALATTPAAAHITLETGTAVAGVAYKAVLRVPHGCSGAETISISVKVPEGFISAKPMAKPGWTITLQTGAYQQSYELYGSTVSEGVLAITWSGGELPDAYYDEFVLRGTFAASIAPGTVVYFPVVQTCVTMEDSWIDTSGDEGAEFPAPHVTIAASAPRQ